MPIILVVEDEPNIRQFIAVNLKARGYTILQAGSAEEGLDQLRKTTPAALVLDIKLPGMNGWAMLNVIDNDPALPKIPTIVMTASSVISQPDEYLYSHLVRKLTKPIGVNDLVKAIREISM